MEQSPSWEANSLNLQLIKKFSAFYGTRKFITVLTSARHLSLSWANYIHSPQPLPTSWRSILILSSHLRLGLPSGLFPSGFSTLTLCTHLPSSIRATCPAHLILLDFITRTILGEEYRSLSSSLCIGLFHYKNNSVALIRELALFLVSKYFIWTLISYSAVFIGKVW